MASHAANESDSRKSRDCHDSSHTTAMRLIRIATKPVFNPLPPRIPNS